MTARQYQSLPSLAVALAIVVWALPAPVAAQVPAPLLESPGSELVLNIDPKTPEKDLLPSAAKSAPSHVNLPKDLARVPEIQFQDLSSLASLSPVDNRNFARGHQGRYQEGLGEVWRHAVRG